MKLLFVHDTYYSRSPTGEIYAYGAFPYSLWKRRFLPYFDSVTVIGREKQFAKESETLDQSSGPHVEHILLPNINSPLKRIFASRNVIQQIGHQVKSHDAVVIRGPVEFGMIAAKAARKYKIPYAIEMSGCAFDHSWYHGSFTGKLYAPVKYLRARKMVRHADAVIYVTKQFLQSRYPYSGLTDHASNVEITAPGNTVLERRISKINARKDPVVFGMIGNFGNNLKGLDIALKALGEVRESLPQFELRLLGQAEPDKWADEIRKAGLKNNVKFHGTRPGGQPVLDWLDDLDIYLHPSRHEGLPRSVIEAMSRGLPCLASDTGGIPELLDQDCIHHKGHADELTRHLELYVPDKNWQIFQARKNFQMARQYSKEILAKKRENFWVNFKNKVIEKNARYSGDQDKTG